KIREAANRSKCSNNLKQLALAVHNFHDTQGRLPYDESPESGQSTAWGLGSANQPPSANRPGTNWSWLAQILPQIEQDNLYRSCGVGNTPQWTLYEAAGLDPTVNTTNWLQTQIPTFLCPSDKAKAGPRNNAADLGSTLIGQTNYKGVSGANWQWGESRWNPSPSTNGNLNGLSTGDGMFYRGDGAKKNDLASVTDGLSNTFMIGEDIPDFNRWCSWPYSNNAVGTCAIYPNSKNPTTGLWYSSSINSNQVSFTDWTNTYSFRSRHPGGLQFALGDGSVRFVKETIDPAMYRAAATMSGGEVVNLQ
ncbi:MAG: DUF1559 domain-containing protein, partial [Zavarzinella sp.]|nr:DUF1559 domain-containing protein [Zavarzinella sp.]